jgi:hypothetical protein
VCGCPTGSIVCTGACVNPLTDRAHCGDCTTLCTGGSECRAGACSCDAGQTLCAYQCVDTSSDYRNCGGCGRMCLPPRRCVSGTCG